MPAGLKLRLIQPPRTGPERVSALEECFGTELSPDSLSQTHVDRLGHLHYVIAAAEHWSFRAAARVLGVQESAISRRIHDFEDEIGAALFIRSHQGVKLTYAGQRFACRARIALDQIGHAAKDVGAIGRAEDGVVRIGIFSSMASGFLEVHRRAERVARQPEGVLRPESRHAESGHLGLSVRVQVSKPSANALSTARIRGVLRVSLWTASQISREGAWSGASMRTSLACRSAR